MKNPQPKEFFNTLFEKDEWVNFVKNNYFETKTGPVEIWEQTGHQFNFFAINPIIKNRSRKAANVKVLRNMLFEMDDVALEDQINLMKKSEMPFTTCTFSGNKSFHFIVSFKTPFDDRITYDAVWRATRNALLKHDAKVDHATKDPARLTRFPNQIRKDTEKIQKLVSVKSRVDFGEFVKWLQSNGVDWQEYLPKKGLSNENQGHSNANVKTKWDWCIQKYMKNDVYEQGNKNNYQFKLSCFLFKTGLNDQQIRKLITDELGKVDERDPVSRAAKTVKDDDPIYVPTLEERRKYYQEQERQERIRMFAQGNTPDVKLDLEAEDWLDVEVKEESIDRYILVQGKHYYKIATDSDELIPWGKSGFEAIYGKDTLPAQQYEGYTFEPDFTSKKVPHNLGTRGQLRNTFIRPNWKIREGRFDTIKNALEHGFGDQYPLILKYFKKLWTDPKHPLPIIWFVGEEDMGKSAVIFIFKSFVGAQLAGDVGSQIESDYTGWLMDKLIIAIEEAGAWKNPGAVMNRLKDLCTKRGNVEINPKFGKMIEYPVYAKFILSTNNFEDMNLTGEATRFWVREINEKPKHKHDNFYQQVEKEMGCFIWHILNRVEIDEKSTARLYFKPEEYETSIKKWVKNNSKSEMYHQIMDELADWFSQHKDRDECYIDYKSVKRYWPKTLHQGTKLFNTCMKKEFGKNPVSPILREDSLALGSLLPNEQVEKRKRGWFVFTRAEILPEDTCVRTHDSYFSV